MQDLGNLRIPLPLKIVNRLEIGLLFVNRSGIITQSDSKSRGLLQVPQDSLEGHSIEGILPVPVTNEILVRLRQSPDQPFEQVLQILFEGRLTMLNSSWEPTPDGFWVFVWQENTDNSTQYLESILTALPDLFFIIDREGRFLETKSKWTNELALPVPEFMGKKIREVFPTSLAEPMMARIESCLKDGQPTSLQYQLPTENGLRDFEARMSPFGEDSVIALARDITAIKETERSLQKMKEFLEQAGQMALVGAFECFPATKQLNWSKATRQIHDVPDDFQENYENALAFFDEGGCRQAIKEAIRNTVFTSIQADLEAKITTFAGVRKWVRVMINSETENGKCVRIYGIIQDITERKKLLENQQQFINEAPSAIAMLDTEMRYMAYSKKWLEDYQISEKNLIGKSHYEIFPEIGEEWREIHAQSLLGKSFGRDDDRFERADGSVNYMKWKINPWYDGEKIGGIIMLTEDVTKEKLALNNQRKLSKIVEESLNEIYIFNRDLAISTANAAATKNLQYNTDELTHMRLTDLTPDISPEDFKANFLLPLFDQEDRSVTAEAIHQRKDGSTYPVKINLKRLVVDGEEYFVAIVLDITERVNHIAAIEEQNRILKEIAWMQSHVVRAPLSRMMMLLSLLENKDIVYGENDLLKSREDVIQSVQETALEIDKIINDISQKTKILDPSTEPPAPLHLPKSAQETTEPELWIVDQDELSQLVNRYAIIQQELSERPRQFHDAEEAWSALLDANQRDRSILVLLDLDTMAQGKTDWFKALRSSAIQTNLAIVTMNEHGNKPQESKWKGHPFILAHISKPLKKLQIAQLQTITQSLKRSS
ncbi:MAG: PAS domain S-box protein [Lunatimonas sp.]|uniref:PAS domain-containing protein n=1 Tax=Lunatimonas sp. TaxID=2060141 RepID=UPI00263B67C1|nr:PAS domain S-box protein [Lunatimonas sp.]MCC5936081.1 PAS domain S-box protein [Lunatimonas sp.]